MTDSIWSAHFAKDPNRQTCDLCGKPTEHPGCYACHDCGCLFDRDRLGEKDDWPHYVHRVKGKA